MVVTHPAGRLPAKDGPSPLADLVTLARPLHAMKSLLLVPIALVDAPGWTADELAAVGWAIGAFILAAAAVYVGNDVADRDRDRHHPDKRQRPIAAGRVSFRAGILYCTTLLVLLGVLVRLGPGGPYWPVLAYLALNVAYSRGLKHVPLLDVGMVALGFVLRIVQGYVALHEPVSAWLVVAVLSVSLLLLTGKRRHELLGAGAAHRPALRGYSVELINLLLPLTGVLSVVAGLIYLATDAAFGSYRQVAVLFSAPFALVALFRYLQVLVVNGGGGDPVRVLLRDRAMVVTGVLWAGALAAIMVLAHHPALAHGVLP
jgi:decaprenyl-phosphate phosphoribosyltransferase